MLKICKYVPYEYIILHIQNRMRIRSECPPPLFPPDLHMNETDMRQSRCTKPPYLGLPPIQYILHFVLLGGGVGRGIKHGRRNNRQQLLNVVFTGVFVWGGVAIL
jgi:hypothetical protein